MLLLLLVLTLSAHAEAPISLPFGITLGGAAKEDEHVLTGAEIGQSFEKRVREQGAEESEDSPYGATNVPSFRTDPGIADQASPPEP